MPHSISIQQHGYAWQILSCNIQLRILSRHCKVSYFVFHFCFFVMPTGGTDFDDLSVVWHVFPPKDVPYGGFVDCDIQCVLDTVGLTSLWTLAILPAHCFSGSPRTWWTPALTAVWSLVCNGAICALVDKTDRKLAECHAVVCHSWPSRFFNLYDCHKLFTLFYIHLLPLFYQTVSVLIFVIYFALISIY